MSKLERFWGSRIKPYVDTFATNIRNDPELILVFATVLVVSAAMTVMVVAILFLVF